MKYKLIKEYPGSPELETVVEEDDGAYYIPDDDSKLTFTELDHYPYTYPEFWEPVVEKDYEILSLVSSNINPQHKKGCKFLHNKDYKFKSMHPTEFWDIYSVKRISDNKIFTIGDSYEDLIIEKMFMSVAGDILTTYKPKSKQPLFTTEDGVNIFENNYYYQIHYPEDWEITKDIAKKIINYTNLVKNNVLYSTKEKAEEYIIMNKPCLSINEINILKNIVFANWDKTLKELVKSKIQQSV